MSKAKTPKLPKISEKQFQKQVVKLAKIRGWRVAHFRPAMTRAGKWVTAVSADGAGFPDLVLVRGGVLMFVELKVPPNGLSDAQVVWLGALRLAGQHAFIWTPGDWEDIEQVLLGGVK